VMLDMMSVQANTGPVWEDKIPRAFWRGRDSRRERLHMVYLSRENKDLLNASITHFFFFRNEESDFGPTTEPISFFDFFQYKYQVNVDGTVAAYRLPFLLAGDSVVFKQESIFYEYFYKQLLPMEHYVPVKHDLSDLIDKIKWARHNDELVYNISRAGQEFVRENLMPKEIYCYHAVLFKKYAGRLKGKVRVREGMESVAQPQSSCSCKPVPRRERREEL